MAYIYHSVDGETEVHLSLLRRVEEDDSDGVRCALCFLYQGTQSYWGIPMVRVRLLRSEVVSDVSAFPQLSSLCRLVFPPSENRE